MCQDLSSRKGRVVSGSLKMCEDVSRKEGKEGKRAIQWKEGKRANDVMKASFYVLASQAK